MPDSAEITEKADGKYQITLTDSSDNVLDVYVINPETGIGTDSAGNEVNLPQTGNNSLKNVLTAVVAFMMTAFGFCAVKLSGINRRKKNEQ
ncbi:MAG: LPXTG cell wall anchor domain-containing protein [Ruminococcus sp.]|nr:LPXTG cell wall anchor domain-containing protein [Ruminococcus sp.]